MTAKQDLKDKIAAQRSRLDQENKKLAGLEEEMAVIVQGENLARGEEVKGDLDVLLKYIPHSRNSCQENDEYPQNVGRCPRCNVLDAFAYNTTPAVESVHVDIYLAP